jgi:hypothetical protein
LPVSSEGERPMTGEFAGKGFLRTGEGAGLWEVCDRKAAKDWMAMLANVVDFWRCSEVAEEGAPSPGRLDGLEGCILS